MFRLGACVGLIFGAAAARSSAQTQPGVDFSAVGQLPASTDMVVAVSRLGQLRAAPQGRALELFLRELSDWDRSTAAWTDLATALGMSQDEALESLLGSQVILAARGMDPKSGATDPEFALLSSIKPDMEARIRARLKPAPRSLQAHLPILALEDGKFELTTSLPEPSAPGAQAAMGRMLLAPSSSSRIFDQLVAMLAGTSKAPPLSSSPEWDTVRRLGPADVLFFWRSPAAMFLTGAKPDYFSLMASIEKDGWEARFVATEPMLTGAVATQPASAVPWPQEAVAGMGEAALLLVAGSPSPTQSDPIAGASPHRALLQSLLDLMELPQDVRAALGGTAIISIQSMGKQNKESGVALMAALPAPDIASIKMSADAWAESLAGSASAGPTPVTRSSKDGVRSVTLPQAGPGRMGGYLPGGGKMVWCYADAPRADVTKPHPGWLVLAVQMGSSGWPDPDLINEAAGRLSGALSHGTGADKDTLFRLLVRPAQLARVIRQFAPSDPAPAPMGVGEGPPAGSASVPYHKDSLTPLRWLKSVESVIVRSEAGVVEGSVNLQFNLDLLPAATRDAEKK